MEPVEFLFKTRLVEGVGAVGHFQSNICPVLWLQRVEHGRKDDALLRGHVLPFVVDEVANDVVYILAQEVLIAQDAFDQHQPKVIVGSSRGGAVAMNLESGDTPLVLLCPAWKKHGTARTVKRNTTLLHSRADDVVPFADSEELVRDSGLSASALIEVGNDHRLADLKALEAMVRACASAE